MEAKEILKSLKTDIIHNEVVSEDHNLLVLELKKYHPHGNKALLFEEMESPEEALDVFREKGIQEFDGVREMAEIRLKTLEIPFKEVSLDINPSGQFLLTIELI